jgi:hypothetical protein
MNHSQGIAVFALTLPILFTGCSSPCQTAEECANRQAAAAMYLGAMNANNNALMQVYSRPVARPVITNCNAMGSSISCTSY